MTPLLRGTVPAHLWGRRRVMKRGEGGACAAGVRREGEGRGGAMREEDAEGTRMWLWRWWAEVVVTRTGVEEWLGGVVAIRVV